LPYSIETLELDVHLVDTGYRNRKGDVLEEGKARAPRASRLPSVVLRTASGSRRMFSPFSSIRVEGIQEHAFIVVPIAGGRARC